MKIVLYRSGFSFLLRSQRGIGIVELLVTIGLVSVIGMIALSSLKQTGLNLPAANQELIARLRLARANATSRGAHFRVTLSSDSYSIQRLEDPDGDGVWSPVGAAENVELPATVSLAVTDGDGVIEFNSRGLVEPPAGDTPPEVERIVMSSSGEGQSKNIEVYPSGQVLEI